MEMADEDSGGPSITSDLAPEDEDRLSVGHEIAESGATDSHNALPGPEEGVALPDDSSNQSEAQDLSLGCPDDDPVILTLPLGLPDDEVTSYSIEKVGSVSLVKRSRGRPRKDFQRPPKHHISPSVVSKAIRGRGRPRRDDILHHKLFPGRPRFRGRKFPPYFLSQGNRKYHDINLNKDTYEITTMKGPGLPERMILDQGDAVPDNELRIEKYCTFCNLPESSLLGQGKMTNFKPTEGFSCFESMEERVRNQEKSLSVSTESGGELKLLFRKQKSLDSSGDMKVQRSRFVTSQGKSSIANDLIQELEVTGFRASPACSEIFEASGELNAHFNCAAWSDGITKTFEKKLSNVDKAVVTAAFQKCSKCDRYGASVKCCFSECTKVYHYPCAIVSGALQNANCFKIICPVHLEHAFSFGVLCFGCHESGDLSQLLLCTTCANYYHGHCMDPPIVPSLDVRAGWQCFECKVCQNCRKPGDVTKMRICNTCDKGYHILCLKPQIASVAKGGWKCSACRMCGDCGARTPGNGPSSRWHLNYTVCDSCYQQRNKGIACPICGRAYRQFLQRKGMKHCRICRKYIHEECDRRPVSRGMNYICRICANSEDHHLDESYVEHHIKDSYQGSSRDSFLSCNEDTLSSEESDFFVEAAASKVSHRRTSSSENKERPKKPPKPKFKNFPSANILFPMADILQLTNKEYKMDDDDPTEDNKLILASATDEFVLCQDLCVMCGSFGKGEEGRLIACAQCGQCYHSYCANIKVTTVVLRKGWRCLDCTVCEGCGQPHDEARLILCDECDISFHIYCLDPPLQEVPQGNWKCRWCVICIQCGSKSPGLNCDWQVNYTFCGPCASSTVCCLCLQQYEENELVICCIKCQRWLHGMCDSIDTEDQAEKCAEYGYICPHCRPPDELPPHLLPLPSPPTPEEQIPEKHTSPIAKSKEPELPPAKAKPVVQYYLDGVYLSESGMKYIKSLVPDVPKKIPRMRKLKHGLLGMMAQETRLFNLDKIEDGVAGEDNKMDTSSGGELGLKAYDFEDGKMVMDGTKDLLSEGSIDKKKRPRKLQKLGIGGFSVKPRGRSLSAKESGTEQADVPTPQPCESSFPIPSDSPAVTGEVIDSANGDKPKKKPKRKPKKKTQLDETFPSYLRDAFFGKELLSACKNLHRTSAHHDSEEGSSRILGSQSHASAERSLATIDVKPHDMKHYISSSSLSPKDLNNTNITYKSMIKSEIASIKEEHLSSASLNDGLPQIDSKEVEDVFQGVLRDHRLSNTTQFRGAKSPYLLQQSTSQGVNHPSHAANLHHSESSSAWVDGECDQSQMQKSILKWESDEHLGLLSTISPVLYANINLPHLKIEYPAWTDRVKQIAKIWRGLPTEKRQPYLQRARENRAASRTQRSSSTDSERSERPAKETKIPDVDHEKQWKEFQAFRQSQQQVQQRIIQEQRIQALKARLQKDDTASNAAELDKNLKLFHSKSLSELPQYQNSSPQEDNKAKVFEKRWSSSELIQQNPAEIIIQQQGSKLLENPTLQKTVIQERVVNSLLQVSKVRPPDHPTLSIPDAAISPSPVVKASDLFQQSPQTTALQQKPSCPPQTQIRPGLLMSRQEGARVVVPPAVQKEGVVSTPPSTPRPHSSESFFQVSTSPQSQLLASLDTHSQPTPSRGQLGPASLVDIGASVPANQLTPTKSPTAAEGASKLQLPQTVEHYVLQQGPAGFHGNASLPKQLLEQKMVLPQQNLEQLLSSGGTSRAVAPPPFQQEKVVSHQHLRDLLQSKKEDITLPPPREEAKLSPPQPTVPPVLPSPGKLKLSDVINNTSIEIDATRQPFPNQTIVKPPEEVTPVKDSPKERLQPEEEKEEIKRKPTAADLVKDLQASQQQEEEEQDVISGTNLIASVGDVGELELDDDELLGLGNDFNILEYADPELDKSLVGAAEKSNILDEHLDLDDKDEELEDEVIKEDKELIQDEKKSLEKPETQPKTSQHLPDDFLDFDKKDGDIPPFVSPNSTTVEQMVSSIKEEPKQGFSSCTISSHTFTPNVDIKLEKGLPDSPCQKIPFPEVQGPLVPPPPSYQMVRALKQAITSPQPNKNMFPLHLNMNLRQELSQGIMSPNVTSNKPLLLQEQPLLLEDLVEQEKREQRRQTQEGLISPHADALLSDIDFERLKDDVFSGPPDDSLGGPGLLGPHDPTVGSPGGSHGFGPPPYSLLWQNQETSLPIASRSMQTIMQNLKSKPQAPPGVMGQIPSVLGSPVQPKAPPIPGNIPPVRPFNPNFSPTSDPTSSVEALIDPEKLKMINYEKYLMQQHAVLTNRQKYFETEVIKLRKAKKALNAKQRQLRKNGAELTENDAAELARVSQEQAVLQKQLEQVRKQARQNTLAVQDYRLKQQKKQQQLQQQQQQPQQQSVPRSPLHPSISSLQSSPQNSQSPLHFSHVAAPPSPMMPPVSPVGHSNSIRFQQRSPSHLMHSPVSMQAPINHVPSLNQALFQQQLNVPFPLPKTEQGWVTAMKMHQLHQQVENMQGGERFVKREPFESTLSSQAFPLPSTPASLTESDIKSVLDSKKTEIIIATKVPEKTESASVLIETPEDSSLKTTASDTAQTPSLIIKDQKPEVESSMDSSQQEAKPDVTVPSESKAEDMKEFVKDPERNPEQANKSECKEQTSEMMTGVNAEILANIKSEIIDDVPSAMDSTSKPTAEIKAEPEGSFKACDSATLSKKEVGNEVSSDEELENFSKTLADKEREQAEQNVLLKQLLQNCPSAETPRKMDSLIELRKEEPEDVHKMEVNFDINDLDRDKLDDKLKKPTYLGKVHVLDIRRAQLEKEPTPPPGERPKPIKRKRPKKKLEKPLGKPEGLLIKKKCRRTSSKTEDGYDSYSENFMAKLTNLPPLRIVEPNIRPNYSAVPVFGVGDLNNRENQMKGRIGAGCIPGQTDVYSFHPYTKEESSSSSILPPSTPPYRGFYNQEFPAVVSKVIEKNETSLALTSSMEVELYNLNRWDAGSPDTVISSSSPESCLFEPACTWPMLVFIDHLLPEKKRNMSPVIPLMYPIPIRLPPKVKKGDITEMEDEKDKENIPDEKEEMALMKTKMSGIGGYSAPLKDSGNVAVTLTLSSAAAEDICGVLSRLADLLKIPIPASYEIVERMATPPSQKLGLYRRSKNNDVSIHSLLNGKNRFCRHCDIVVLSAGIRKKTADLTYMSKEEQDEDEVIFCSTNCYMQFALTHRSTAVLEEKEAAAVVDHVGETYSNNPEDRILSPFIHKDKEHTRTLREDLKDENPDLTKLEAMDVEEGHAGGNNSNAVLQVEVKVENKQGEGDMVVEKMELQEDMDETYKKWRSVKYKFWFPDNSGLKTKKKEESSEKPVRPFYHTIKPSQMPKDERKCIFCHGIGDGDTNGSARLLNVDVNKWVHLNCALWSSEVYETVNGALMNVEQAFKRSRLLNCCLCHKQGASARCFKTRCPNIYHFPCARKENCVFYGDKTMLCPQHVHRGNPENEMDSVAVFRRVYINRESHKQVASMIQDDKYVMRVGSLIFLNIGQLLPTQIQAFHNTNCIYPVGYKVIRMYWSMRKLGRRTQYTCTLSDVGGKPEFSIQLKDGPEQKDLILKDKSAKGAWQKVLFPIEKMRRQAKTIKMFPDCITGDDLFGLTEPAVLRILESLPGVDTLNDYNFRYGRSPFLELPLAINPTGCARSEPKLRTHFRRAHTLHTSSSTRSSLQAAFGGLEVSSPYVKQFVHSKSSQYRKMKIEWRNNVFLARSRIQGLGLYAARDMEKHTMVMEYIGQIIRNEISERNEAVYNAQNRGVYMFRLDENRVVDATLCGGLARYMNHSCNPNCQTENVQIDRENKIIIITNRRVSKGEELSYDYKFDVEDDQHKIPCLCGSWNCRKWMN